MIVSNKANNSEVSNEKVLAATRAPKCMTSYICEEGSGLGERVVSLLYSRCYSYCCSLLYSQGLAQCLMRVADM